jgi:uncharacterized DUF497 family protein
VQFDWDQGNLGHIALHRVTAEEVEEVLEGDLVHTTADVRSGEIRITVLGLTEGGRLLSITFTQRGSRVRVVTARDASRRERKLYAET